MDKISTGKNIRKYRKVMQFTQEQLAQKIGRTESSIRKYEKGLVEIPTNVLSQLADALEVSVWSLLGISKDDAYSEVENYNIMGEFYEDENDRKEGELLTKIVEMDKFKGKLPLIIKKRMEMLNMSFEELSNISQIPLSKLNNSHYFDNPEITLNELKSLSEALGVSLDYLAGNECIKLPSSYYESILGLINECGVTIKFNKLCDWFDISYENAVISADYTRIKNLKDEILAFTKFKISEMFKD